MVSELTMKYGRVNPPTMKRNEPRLGPKYKSKFYNNFFALNDQKEL